MADANAPDLATLSGLPKAERRQALTQTGLVRQYEPGDQGTGLLIQAGRITSFNSDGWSSPFPHHLLEGDGEVALDAKEVLLSENRVVLDGTPSESLSFLASLGPSVTHLRAIDVCFSLATISGWLKPESTLATDWRKLATFLAEETDIEKVDLALDAGIAFETYQEWRATEANLPQVLEAYRDITKALAEALKGTKPKSFHAYWAAFHDYEVEAEKTIMGPDYDSLAEGKIPSTGRNPYFPHGTPEKRLEWDTGMAL